MNGTKDICVAHIDTFKDRDRDPEKFQNLVNSIEKHGLIEPIIVGPNPKEGSKKKPYMLMAGHGRLLAAKKLGWQKIPAVVEEKFELRVYLGENSMRRDLSPFDAAICMESELQMGRAVDEVAKLYCVTVAVVKQYASIVRGLNPELAKLAKRQMLTMTDARRVAVKLRSHKVQEVLVNSIRRAEKFEPTAIAVKRAVEDVIGAVSVRGSTTSIDTVEKLEKVREEVKADMRDAKEAYDVIGSHWRRSVWELRTLLTDGDAAKVFRKLFDKHGIEYKHVLKSR